MYGRFSIDPKDILFGGYYARLCDTDTDSDRNECLITEFTTKFVRKYDWNNYQTPFYFINSEI